MNHRQSLALLVSLVLHALVLFSSGWLLAQKAEFGVQVFDTNSEVELVAAEPEPPAQKPPPTPVPSLKPDDVPELQPKPKTEPQPPQKPVPSPKHLSHGEIVSATPGYENNPKPEYPEFCQKMGQQGVVELIVKVSETGRVLEVSMQKSSGYSKLDTSALKAVHQWTFHPGTIGGIPVVSEVEVPIRFELKNR